MRHVLSGPFADPILIETVTGRRPETDAGGAVTVWLDDETALARLAFCGAVHAARVTPASGGAETHVGPGPDLLGGHRFDTDIPARWREIWREAAGEIMDCHGRESPDVVRGRLVMIWARAESRLRARAALRTPPSGLDRGNVHVESVATPYAKFFLLRDYVYSHDLFGGGRSRPLDRAVLVMADAVTVLPWDPVRDRVLVIEQIRPSPLARDDPCPWLLEPIAGRIDPGDTPEETAHKEAAEEARLTLGALHKIGEYYPSTGAFSEYLYSFIGLADLPDDAAKLGGLETEGEDIRGHVMPRAALMARIAAGEAPVGPLMLSAFWLQAHASRLQQAG